MQENAPIDSSRLISQEDLQALSVHPNILRTIMAVLYSKHEIKNILASLRGHLDLWAVALAREGRGRDWEIVNEQLRHLEMIINEHTMLYNEVSRIIKAQGLSPFDMAEKKEQRWVHVLHYIQTWLMVLRSGCASIQPPKILSPEDADVLVSAATKAIERFDLFMSYIATTRLATHIEELTGQQLCQWLQMRSMPVDGVKTTYMCLSVDGTCLADKHLLDLIVGNIEQNACDAMLRQEGQDPGKDKCLTVAVSQRQANGSSRLQIRFSDTGPGILPEDQEKLFDLFFTKGKQHGTGIGLALVAEAVKHLSAAVELESEVGKGTAFTLVLPVVA